MADLTLPLIGLTSLMGYFFAKQGKNERKTSNTVDEMVNPNEKPNDDTIYQSNKTEKVTAEELKRASQNYKDAENPAQTGVIPPLFNTYSVVGDANVFTTGVPSASVKQESERNDLNRRKDILAGPALDITQRPMFQGNQAGSERDYISFTPQGPVVDQQVSLLTGKPIDPVHNNMTPFFGSNVKQNVETFVNQPVLDKFTGNTSTFSHKREISPLFQAKAQDIYGTPLFTVSTDTDRYIPSVYRQNELPFEQEQVPAPIEGTIDNTIRPSYKEVNELRVGNRLKQTYDGRTIAGQRGDIRGVQAHANKNRPDTYYEKGFDHWFRTTSDLLAPTAKENYDNLRPTARKDSNIEYVGGGAPAVSTTTSRPIVQDAKRFNFDNDYTRNVTGNSSTTDYGRASHNPAETERATTTYNRYDGPLVHTGSGIKTRFGDDPKSTIKETTLAFDNSGNVKTEFNDGQMGAYDIGISGVFAKTTHKETTAVNEYTGVADRSDGLGYIVSKYDAKTTGKQIISDNSEYTGSALQSSGSESRTKFDNAFIRDTKEIVAQRDRRSGPQKFQIASGQAALGDRELSATQLLKEREDDRPKMNVNFASIIPDKNSVGVKTKFRFDDEPVDTVTYDRIQPDLVIGQHAQNPYSLYGKNM